MSQTAIDKIVQRFAVDLEPGQEVRAGDYVSIRPAHVLTHDNTGAVIPKFRSIGATRVADPRQAVFALDHDIQNTSPDNLRKYAAIERFAHEQGIDFYPAGRGIGHQVMCEEGYAWPGTLVVASDSHANMYGGLGCLGTPVVRTDAAAIWATGCTWWQVPPVARVTLTGHLRPGVTGKDVILALCGAFTHDEVLNHAVEFGGEGVGSLSVEERLTIANMTTEWGALAGLFPVDARTMEWLERTPGGVSSRRHKPHQIVPGAFSADADAEYAIELSLDLSTVPASIVGPNSVHTFAAASELAARDIRIDKAYLLSCVNSRVEDLAAAAAVLRGHRISPGVRFYLAAASSEVQAESERRGDWSVLMEAGAIALPPGCGPCIGLGTGTLADGEVGISATNRNFKGRMGAPGAVAYLASPAIVAASAMAGRIAVPEGTWPGTAAAVAVTAHARPGRPRPPSKLRLVPGFPSRIRGGLLFCPRDGLNTDGIYPGKYTYRDDFTPAEQASVVMENYDPSFRSLLAPGDILVGGFNFGTGSSREQAATALKYAGIALVIAGSFSETYKRNALNNGLLAIEAPELVRDLKVRFAASSPTIRTELAADVDFEHSRVTVDGRTYAIGPVGAAAQELIVAGGLEGWVKAKLERLKDRG